MNIVFMGTPVYAVPCLEALVAAGHKIGYVFSQPDKQRDRGQKLSPPPVKECALKHGIPVFQPVSLRTGEDGEKSGQIIRQVNPDCIIVVAYGQILPKDILDIPRLGCINVHASLLPRYRGASPINYTIIKGEKQTGVSVMYMSVGLDSGDVILQEAVNIPEDAAASAMHDELMAVGSRLLMRALPLVESGAAPRKPQDSYGIETCYAPMITKQMCHIDWSAKAEDIYNLIRGLDNANGAFTMLGDKRLKIYFAGKTDIVSEEAPGTVADPAEFTVVCGDRRVLKLTNLQYEGGKRMSAKDFLRGRKIEPGTVLK